MIGAAAGDLRTDERESLQPFHLERETTDDAVLVGGEVRVPGARSQLLEGGRVENEVRPTLVVHFGGGEDHETRVAKQRVAESVVLRGRAVLRELDVEGDRPRLALGDRFEHPGVHPPRERPLLVELLERHVVDLDDDDARGRRLVAADREAEIDGLALEVVEEAEVEQVRGGGREDRAQGNEQEEPRPEAHVPRIHGLEG